MIKYLVSNKQVFVIQLCLICFAALFTQLAFAEINYNYDQAGRLTHATDSINNAIIYTYDSNGNVISITRTTSQNFLPPVITSMSHTIIRQGATDLITIDGTNLTGSVVSIDNPDVNLNVTSVVDTKIDLTSTVPFGVPTGGFTVTITTFMGSDAVPMAVGGPLPKINNMMPLHGTSIGGTFAEIFGEQLTFDTLIDIGGASATSTVFIDENSMLIRTPDGIPNTTADVTVTNSNGSTSLANGFRYTFPFRVPIAISFLTGTSSDITLSLTEQAFATRLMSISNENSAVISIPSLLTILLDSASVAIPVSVLADGASQVTLTLGQATKIITLLAETNPVDTDGDGLTDALEAILGTNPNISDTDNDGLSDGDEINLYGTDPLDTDTDGDGYSDSAEVNNNTDPADAFSLPAIDILGPAFNLNEISVFMPVTVTTSLPGDSFKHSSGLSVYMPIPVNQTVTGNSFGHNSGLSVFMPIAAGSALTGESFNFNSGLSVFLPMDTSQPIAGESFDFSAISVLME